MPTITLFTFDKKLGVKEAVKKIDRQKFSSSWFLAKPSKYNRFEVFIQYFFYQHLEDELKRIIGEEDSEEIVSLLKSNGKIKVLKKVYCFLNVLTRTFEVYRGPDALTQEIVKKVEKLLGVELKPVRIDAEKLKKIYSEYGLELKQAIFKNVDGLMYQILRGRNLETNKTFEKHISKNPESLRVVSFRPKIRPLNNEIKYQVTLNGDRGTLKFSENGEFKWRPRFEVRQIIFALAHTLGLLRFKTLTGIFK